ncbi:MAG: LamB/YcsF family protein [Nocardioidaceae bacterium]|nr:LamB/YcsF family protein [Nocardioidaceae bacterium]MCL2614032.1 LamB/YcsF family protein [Nocardioidaceae bacterium]
MDLNADVGESFGRWTLGDDAALLPHLTSANVACGFHAGDPLTLRRTVAMCVSHGVVIGAQVGYRDLAGFGRRFIDLPAAELTADVLYQLGALEGLARVAGDRIRYVKPHGALYHAVNVRPEQAQAVVDAVVEYGGLPVMGMPDSPFLLVAQAAGLPVVTEGFADRGYTPEGGLVPRGRPGALLDDPAAAAEQAVRLAPSVDSLCVHGDSPGATDIAAAIRSALDAEGIEVAAFA